MAISLQDATELTKWLEKQSAKLEQPEGEDYGESVYAYIDKDGNVLDVCLSDFFQGSSEPVAAISLPWDGSPQELINEIEEQTYEEEEEDEPYLDRENIHDIIGYDESVLNNMKIDYEKKRPVEKTQDKPVPTRDQIHEITDYDS